MNNSTGKNTSLGNDSETGSETTLPLGFTVVQYMVIVLGCCANSFICFSFAYYRRIRTVNNYFVFNLAVSDMLLIVSLCLAIAVSALVKNLSEGDVQVLICFETFCSSASVASVTVISYDRYYSVTKPLHYTGNITHKKAIIFIACIWMYATVVGLLQILYSLPNRDYFTYGYIPLLGLFNSVLPLIIMLYCYITIFIIASRHLRHNPHRGQDPNSPANVLIKNLKIAFHILVLVAPLLLFWSTYFAITVTEVYCNGCIPFNEFQEWLISMMPHILAAVDPIIYIFLTKDFRKIVCGWFKLYRSHPLSVSETFHLSTTKSTNPQALPTAGSERLVNDIGDSMVGSYRHY